MGVKGTRDEGRSEEQQAGVAPSIMDEKMRSDAMRCDAIHVRLVPRAALTDTGSSPKSGPSWLDGRGGGSPSQQPAQRVCESGDQAQNFSGKRGTVAPGRLRIGFWNLAGKARREFVERDRQGARASRAKA